MTVYEGRDRSGRYLEEFEVGDVYRHWPGRTITPYDNLSFTLLTMNQSAGHLDQYYAETEMDFGGKLLVNGLLVLSVIHGMSVVDVSSSPKAVAQLGWKDIAILSPTFHGDTLYAYTEVLETRASKSRADCGVVTVKTTGIKQDETVVLEFTRSILVKRRSALNLNPPAGCVERSIRSRNRKFRRKFTDARVLVGRADVSDHQHGEF